MPDPAEADAIDVEAALRNVLAQLQQEPRRYRLFGLWWWPVKALLKGAGYGRDQLYLLGDYQGPGQAAMVPEMPLRETLAAAFAEFGHNARYPRPGGVVEDPEGELVTIFDADAGF
jgi:hypothetical protein